jgi:glutamyl-tRNA synthetase
MPDEANAIAGADGHAEPIFPPSLRPAAWHRAAAPGNVAWRFRVPDGRVIEFGDGLCGTVQRTAGVDFGDFVVWRRDDLAAYELAVVADDHAMEIEEVVRGEDLWSSTAAQVAVLRQLGAPPPRYAHVPLWRDAAGQRLSKREGSEGLAGYRARGWDGPAVIGDLAASLGLVTAGERLSADELLEELRHQPGRLSALLGRALKP